MNYTYSVYLSKTLNWKNAYSLSEGTINFPDPIKCAFSCPSTGRNLSSKIYSLVFLPAGIFIGSIEYFQRNDKNLLSKTITNIFHQKLFEVIYLSCPNKQIKMSDWTFSARRVQFKLSHFGDQWIFSGAHFMHFVDCRLPEPAFLGLITPFNISSTSIIILDNKYKHGTYVLLLDFLNINATLKFWIFNKWVMILLISSLFDEENTEVTILMSELAKVGS